jgi:hypothetical protein
MVDAPGLIRSLRRCCFTPSPERTSLKKKTVCAPSHRKKLGNSAELIAFPQLEFLTPPAISEAITNSPHQARTQIGGRSFFEEVSSQVYQEIPTS